MYRPLACTAVALALVSPAHAFLAQNDLVVRDLGNGAFEVPYRGKSGARDFWCAAGDYVLRHLRMPVETRIYRTSSPPRRSGDGITFSLSPSGAKATGLAHFGPTKGVSAAHARELCEIDRLIDRND